MKARLIKRFEDEIAVLERELNHELPKEIQRARELGDLRENAEYQAAKERQRFVEARVSMLRQRVAEMKAETVPFLEFARRESERTACLRPPGYQ